MRSYSVLVVGSVSNARLVDAIFAMGLVPVVRDRLATVVSALRGQCFEAVVVDSAHSADDPLELVLNLREFDTDVPVVVLMGLDRMQEGLILASLHGTVVVRSSSKYGHLVSALADVLGAAPETGQEAVGGHR